MPRLSVIVPVYNVEDYLEECLDSVVAQTFTDYECVMVDDGSTDESAAIAERYAARDQRFRLVSQENGGLSKARNTGIDHSSGELLVFLDSDDVLPANAYELLVGALDESGSDFATGNVYRLTRFALTQARYVAKAFEETRLKTHVTKLRPLLADRTAWNKVFRRSFWDEHGFRFPEGRTYEDTPITIPAHFLARSVDVIADPVYYWRIRDSGGLSITQRRFEPQSLIDRLTSIQEVSEHLAADGPRGSKRWYDETVVADDLRHYVNTLDMADDAYRQLFLDRVNEFLDQASKGIYRDLPAIERLKWYLIRRRMLPELLEVLRFQKEDLAKVDPLRIRGRWYGDYPYRTDRRLKIPRSVYRLEGDFTQGAAIERLAEHEGGVEITGHTYITGIGASTRDAQRVEVALLPPGRFKRVRLMTTAVRVPVRTVHRPDVTANARQSLVDLSWSGFVATLAPGTMRRLARRHSGRWELYVTVRAGGVKRRRSRFYFDITDPIRPVTVPVSGDNRLTVALTRDEQLAIDVRSGSATVQSGRVLDGALELAVDVRPALDGKPALELRRDGDGRRVRVPLRSHNGAGPGSLTAQVPLAKIQSSEDSLWQMTVAGKGVRLPATAAGALADQTWRAGDRELMVARAGLGAALFERAPRAVIEELEWTREGDLHVVGQLPDDAEADAISLFHEMSGQHFPFPIGFDPDGRFVARLMPARVQSLGGALPVWDGTWELRVDGVPVRLRERLRDRLPLAANVEHKPFALKATIEDRVAVRARRDLDEDERGLYHQRRLRTGSYEAGKTAPLRDAIVYSSFRGRQYSDNPRAIHEELVRRDSPLDHLWVVYDGRCTVPETATALRAGSREYYEAMAQARYVIANDHFPDWFVRRDDQICVQTWHGTPLKRIGMDLASVRKRRARFGRAVRLQAPNWQYVLSPNRYATPIMQRAYEIEGEIWETGYPRADVLSRRNRDELRAQLRGLLALPEDRLVVLYAPTFRDHVSDRQRRSRLEPGLDIERLRQAVGRDAVVLYRKHHEIYDAVPATADGFVRDVSSYPDATTLLLAADVLVTDYSSLMVDFANTGRPMLFYTYDLEAYENEIRGFSLDFEATVPGPLLRTTDELGEALRGLDAVRADYAERYAQFRATFCEFDDGGAAARVVDRLMS
jgi:CDP-glycerol glycerophosphotransferase